MTEYEWNPPQPLDDAVEELDTAITGYFRRDQLGRVIPGAVEALRAACGRVLAELDPPATRPVWSQHDPGRISDHKSWLPSAGDVSRETAGEKTN